MTSSYISHRPSARPPLLLLALPAALRLTLPRCLLPPVRRQAPLSAFWKGVFRAVTRSFTARGTRRIFLYVIYLLTQILRRLYHFFLVGLQMEIAIPLHYQFIVKPVYLSTEIQTRSYTQLARFFVTACIRRSTGSSHLHMKQLYKQKTRMLAARRTSDICILYIPSVS